MTSRMYVHVYSKYMHAHVYCIRNVHTCMHMYMPPKQPRQLCTCMYVCMYVCTYICIYVFMQVCVYMYVCIYVMCTRQCRDPAQAVAPCMHAYKYQLCSVSERVLTYIHTYVRTCMRAYVCVIQDYDEEKCMGMIGSFKYIHTYIQYIHAQIHKQTHEMKHLACGTVMLHAPPKYIHTYIH